MMPSQKPKSTDAAELSTAAIAILEAAAGREDGALRPLPIRMPPAAERSIVAKLREAGLIETLESEGGPLDRIAERGRTRLAMRALRAALEGQAASVGDPSDSGAAARDVPQEVRIAGEGVDAPADLPEPADAKESGAGAPRAGEEDESFEPPAFLRRDGGAAQHASEHSGEAVDAEAPRERRRGSKAGPAAPRPRADVPPIRAKRAAGPPVRQPGEGAPIRQTKGARLIELLRRPGGATISELTGELGWLAHTVRARIAVDVRGRGHAVATERVERDGRRVTIYRVRPVAPA